MIGSSAGPGGAGFQFAVVLIIEILSPLTGIWIAAGTPGQRLVGVLNPFFFGIQIATAGIVIPWNQMAPVYRYFVYYANPLQWAQSTLKMSW